MVCHIRGATGNPTDDLSGHSASLQEWAKALKGWFQAFKVTKYISVCKKLEFFKRLLRKGDPRAGKKAPGCPQLAAELSIPKPFGAGPPGRQDLSPILYHRRGEAGPQ